MPRVLLLSTTTGYQARAFRDAGERAGIDLLLATDRCHVLDDPWRDAAIPVRFHAPQSSVRAIVQAATARPVDGLLALGDRPTVIAAQAAEALRLPGHPPAAARAASNKLLTRDALRAAGLLTPWFTSVPRETDPGAVAATLRFPCVVKPLALSGSRGVIRADDAASFLAAFRRLARLLAQTDVRALRDPANDEIVIEGFIEGSEFALEGILEGGRLRTLALFDKPDPLDGPFFEETIYVTPSGLPATRQHEVATAVQAAAAALGLRHGPVHAECRLNPRGVYVLEVAARPIGGLCARALRFAEPDGDPISLEELLLRHAVGQDVARYERAAGASAVMMIPIPRRGFLKKVDGLEEALEASGVEEIRITAKPDQLLVPLPEGASYLGFIFARADTPQAVESALRCAHERLRFQIDVALPVA